MENQGQAQDAIIDSLLQENEELHYIIHHTRQQAISLFMAFLNSSAETAQVPPSWLMSYIINDDPSVLNYTTANEWPEGYEKRVLELCDIMSFYNGIHQVSIPVKIVALDILNWPYPNKTKKSQH